MAYTNPINFSKLHEELNKPKTYNDGPKVPGRKVFPFWEYAKLGKESSQYLFVAGEFKSRLSDKILPWFEGFEHRTAIVNEKGMKEYPFVACSAGNDKNDKQPCVGCHYFESNKPAPYTKKENRAANPWGQKLFTVFCVVHLAWYKRVIRLNKDGVPVVFADVPQYNEILCPEGEEGTEGTFFGKLLKLKLGNNHYKDWVSFANQLHWVCDGCGFGIVSKKMYCRDCGQDFIAPTEINKLTRGEQEAFMSEEQTCTCGVTALPLEDLACGYDPEGKMLKRKAGKNPCPLGDAPPQRMNIFNSILSLTKTGSGTDSKLNLVDKMSFNVDSDISWTAPTENIGAPISEIIASVLERNGGLYDIEKDYPFLDMDAQSKELRVTNPYAAPKDLPKRQTIPQNPTAMKTPELKVHFPK